MAKFKNGISINTHSGKLKHLRIKAGPQRDRYLHDIVFEAKILGRREAWQLLHPTESVPEDDFFRYLDTTWETVDHNDQNSLNNSPANLVRMMRGDNVRKANRVNGQKRRDKKAAKAAATKVPF